MTESVATQILRILDKHHKLGTEGVIDLLMRPSEKFGAELRGDRARLIGSFMDTMGATNRETIANMREWFSRNARVSKETEDERKKP